MFMMLKIIGALSGKLAYVLDARRFYIDRTPEAVGQLKERWLHKHTHLCVLEITCYSNQEVSTEDTLNRMYFDRVYSSTVGAETDLTKVMALPIAFDAHHAVSKYRDYAVDLFHQEFSFEDIVEEAYTDYDGDLNPAAMAVQFGFWVRHHIYVKNKPYGLLIETHYRQMPRWDRFVDLVLSQLPRKIPNNAALGWRS